MIAGLISERLLLYKNLFLKGVGIIESSANYNHKGVNLWLMSLAKVSIS